MKKYIVLLLIMAISITGFAQTVTTATAAPKKHKKHVTVKKRVEKVVINDKSQKTVVEIKNDKIYVDGTVVSTIKSAKNEDHKIVINHKGGHKKAEGGEAWERKERAERPEQKEMAEQKERAERTERPEQKENDERGEAANGSGSITIDKSFERVVPDQSNVNHNALLGVYTNKSAPVDGAYVDRVMSNTPAENAGLTTGDIITKVNETPIKSSDDLINTIATYQAGDVVIITYSRNGNNEQVRVPLADKVALQVEVQQDNMNRYQEYEQRQNNNDNGGYNNDYNNRNDDQNNYRNDFGYNARFGRERKPVRLGISASDGRRPRGVYLDEVKEGGPAEAAGLQKGDIITRINGERVRYAGEMQELLSFPGIGNVIVVDYKHNGQKMHTEVHVENERNEHRHYSHQNYNYGRD